jgi:hypothetical protein
MDVIYTIFEYMYASGFTIEGYDLLKLLDAEDDDDEGVPPEGVDGTLLELMDRIHDPDHSDHIITPPDIRQLWNDFCETSWPSDED